MRILLIGTGRMAYHLGHNITRTSFELIGVAGRDAEKTADLARFLDRPAFRLNALPEEVDLVIIATSDDSIHSVATALPYTNCVIAHTAGAAGLDLLEPHAHRAVLWPIQTLSHGAPVDLGPVPIVVDANDAVARETILRLSRAISESVFELTHEQRELLHLTAVLASNLPVFLMHEAQRLLKQQKLPTDLLLPLWRTTAHNVVTIGPEAALTGPARRGDLSSIKNHLEHLSNEPDLQRIYALLSAMILKANDHPTDGIDL